MFDNVVAECRSRQVRRRRDARPEAEGLEQRLLMYTTSGGRWNYTSPITYSLIPDGTSIGGTPSNLLQSMGARFGSWAWFSQIQEAAATWQAIAEINVALAPWDSGAPIGAPGAQQGDPYFGDIRIGGAPLAPGVLAIAYATPPFNGGTLAGDIIFNTDQLWRMDGGAYDLKTVALHEFGHALGMSHSATASAAMYAGYTGTKPTLTADDVLGMQQSIYGPPQPDGFDAAQSNSSHATATGISGAINPQGQLTLGSLDLTGVEQDWYRIYAPASTVGTMTVAVQSSNLSSLSPSVRVQAANLAILGTASAAGSFGGTARVTIGGVQPGQMYYIRVVGADYGPSGEGGYGLQVNFAGGTMPPIPKPYTYVPAQPNQQGGAYSAFIGESFDAATGVLETKRRFALSSKSSEPHLTSVSYGSLTGIGDALMVDDVEGAGHDHDPARGPAGLMVTSPFDYPKRVGWIVPMDGAGKVPDAAPKPKTPRPMMHVRLTRLAALDRVLNDWSPTSRRGGEAPALAGSERP